MYTPRRYWRRASPGLPPAVCQNATRSWVERSSPAQPCSR
jgi:hypothetical protein